MKFIDEYRDARAAHRLADAVRRLPTRPWNLMEVCGGQTHAIVRFGLDRLLPPEIGLLHGPGCPVCITPVETIDRAVALAARPDITLCSFGDMLRVPGSQRDLLDVKAHGGDVRIVYSPLDALALARARPDRQVVFFAVGFETTAPAHAMVVHQARLHDVRNFTLLVSHARVPPALEAILDGTPPGEPRRVHGFLAAGHVCAVMGTTEYEPIAARYRVPIVVTGFEPLDILQGVYQCVRQLEAGRAEVENAYGRAVQRAGNRAARRLVEQVFEIVPRQWRGIGPLESSGLGLRAAYADFDAARRFGVDVVRADEPADCISGQVLQGRCTPLECTAFATRCTPDTPLGATMVSSEGTCAAYFRYRRLEAAGAAPAGGAR